MLLDFGALSDRFTAMCKKLTRVYVYGLAKEKMQERGRLGPQGAALRLMQDSTSWSECAGWGCSCVQTRALCVVPGGAEVVTP